VRILVVDDSPDSRALIRVILREAGYTDVVPVGSAEEAFRSLGVEEESAVLAPFDLVLMDIQMPGVDGLEACRRIRAQERMRDVPVIVVTAETEDVHLQSAFDAGAVDYLAKPVRSVELVARARSALKLKQEMDQRKQREAELIAVAQQLETANQELRRLSFLDGLTGITNRRGFDEYFLKEWRRAVRAQGSLSVILLDVDHFKPFNDHYGHLAGDDCLKHIAAALRSALHRPADLVARYGGEEFVVVLPDTDPSHATVVAETLRTAVEDLRIPHASSPSARSVTVSLGVASVTAVPDASPQGLVDAADQALYAAKRAGRNRSVTAPPFTGLRVS
jgi:diguanylate cyclase (GGDEF)-like protein